MFTQSGMRLQDAYNVLGVSCEVTLKEIRTEYHRKLRYVHPDYSNCTSATAETARLNEAWEIVQRHHVDKEKPTVTTYFVYVQEFRCELIRTIDDWQEVKFTLKLPLSYFALHQGKLILDFDGEEAIEDYSEYRLKIEVVSEYGKVLFGPTSRWHLSIAYEQYQRAQRVESLRQELNSLEHRLDTVPLVKKPSTHPVFDLIQVCARELEAIPYSLRLEQRYLKVRQLFRQISREIDQLVESDPVGLAVAEIMTGRLSTAVHKRNLLTVEAINAAAIQTGGLVDQFDEEDMRVFYSRKLSDAPNPLALLNDPSLLLDIEDYAPAEFLDDPEVEVAPRFITLPSNKGEATIPVAYRYVNGQPTAIVRLSLKTYRLIAPDYGKRTGLPKLPHGIIWAAEITHDKRIIVSGLVNDDLMSKVSKWERGHKRAKHADDFNSLGAGLYGFDRGEVPPWYVGVNKPGRRR